MIPPIEHTVVAVNGRTRNFYNWPISHGNFYAVVRGPVITPKHNEASALTHPSQIFDITQNLTKIKCFLIIISFLHK